MKESVIIILIFLAFWAGKERSKTVTENNKLIVEFMGREVITEKDFLAYNYEELKDNMYIDTTLKYHSSFDWLMEVAEKIESLGYQVVIEKNNCNIINWEYTQVIDPKFYSRVIRSATKIEAVYNAVVSFIEWYNEQKNIATQDSIDIEDWGK